MGSKILKFLLVGLLVPSAISTSARASTTSLDASDVRPPVSDADARPPSEKEIALVEEDAYTILMRARLGIQNWAKSNVYQGSSAFSYGTDIGVYWKSGFGLAGHFWTGQSGATKIEGGTGVDGSLRLSTMAAGPAYQLRKGRSYLQARVFVGHVLLSERYTTGGDGVVAGEWAQPASVGYFIYGAGLGIDIPIRAQWFASLAAEYGWLNPLTNQSGVEGFAVNSLSTGLGYRF